MDLAAIWPVTHHWCLRRFAAARKASFAARNISLGLGMLALGGLLVGCAAPAGAPPGNAVSFAPAVPSNDPLIAFVSGAAPGGEGASLGGIPARYRLMRSYSAASGAECREVQETPAGGFERLRLVCRDPSGQWREARPLLSNVSQRP